MTMEQKDEKKNVIFLDDKVAPNIEVWKIYVLDGRNAGQLASPICCLTRCSKDVAERVCRLLEEDINSEDA